MQESWSKHFDNWTYHKQRYIIALKDYNDSPEKFLEIRDELDRCIEDMIDLKEVDNKPVRVPIGDKVVPTPYKLDSLLMLFRSLSFF